MKLLLVFAILLVGCTTPSNPTADEWKAAALQASQTRTAEIIAQLKQDCDSNLLQTARYKADSIMKARKKR